MKFHLLFRLGVLQYVCIYFVSSNCGATSYHKLTECVKSSQQKSLKQSKNCIERLKIKFTDLNDDILFDIIDNLPLKDWPSMIKINSKLLHFVGDAFHRKYRSYEVKILDTHSTDGKTIVESLTNERVEIHDFDAAVVMLIHFGHSIKRLNIKSEQMSKSEAAVINQLIQTYCLKVTHLNLGSIKADTLQQFKMPFQNVKELIIIIKEKQVKSGILPMNQLFPNISRLNFAFHENVDLSFIDYEFPMLAHFYAANDACTQVNRIESMLTKNMQIKSIELEGFPKDYVRIINKHLQNIENLTLSTFNIGDVPLHMENVKNFILYETSPVSIDKLSFSHIDSLQMYFTPIFATV